MKIPKTLLFIAVVAFPFTIYADAPNQLLNCDGQKIVTYGSTTSDDGRYAIGWTILRLKKTAKPVDWSLWNADEDSRITFQDRYPSDYPVETKTAYGYADFVLDLKDRKALRLKNTWEFGNPPRISWNSGTSGSLYAITWKDQHFGTRDLRLIIADPKQLRCVDLLALANDAVNRLLRNRRPYDYDRYFAVYFSVDSFKAGHASVSFDAQDLKSPGEGEDAEIDGKLSVRLQDGVIENVTSDSKTCDPFKSDPVLAKADAELNDAYSQLTEKTKGGALAKLKNDQRQWIDSRDRLAIESVKHPDTLDDDGDTLSIRTSSLLDSTRKRTAILKQRLREDSRPRTSAIP